MYDERIRAHQPQMYAWERQIADGVTLADLNEKHIRGCIRLGVEGGRIPANAMSAPIDDTLAKWNLLKNNLKNYECKIIEEPVYDIGHSNFYLFLFICK